MHQQISIPIGGFHKQSLIDYPGHISALIFTAGCNFACSYCHNAQLIGDISKHIKSTINLNKTIDWIADNKGMLDAVVITGGEPSLHKELPLLIENIKQLNLKVKLDTNGTNPNMLNYLIEEKMVDYIAMDIKAPLELLKYQSVVGKKLSSSMLHQIKKSVEILKQNNVDYEFRTTLDKRLTYDDFNKIATKIGGTYVIQNQLDANKNILTKLNFIELQKQIGNQKHINLYFRN